MDTTVTDVRAFLLAPDELCGEFFSPYSPSDLPPVVAHEEACTLPGQSSPLCGDTGQPWGFGGSSALGGKSGAHRAGTAREECWGRCGQLDGLVSFPNFTFRCAKKLQLYRNL